MIGKRDASVTTVFVLLIGVLVIVGYGVILRHTYTLTYQGANDFYIPWRAIQMSLWENQDPYSADVTSELQRTLFGHVLGPNKHQFDFAYPFTLAPLLAPYTFFTYTWAQPLWQATIHVFLVVGLLLWLSLLQREKGARSRMEQVVVLFGILLGSITFYPVVRAFYLGQVALFVFGALVAAMWAVHHRHDTTAGAALALATVKPQLSFLIVPLLLTLAWLNGRRDVIKSFALTLCGLLILSLVLMPTWPAEFMQRLIEYQQYTTVEASTDSPSPLSLLLRLLGPTAVPLGILFVATFVLPLLWEVWQQQRRPDWVQAGSGILLISAWIAPRAATTDQTLLLLPALYLLSRRSRVTAIPVAGIVWVGLWYLFLTTLQVKQEHLIVRLLLPIILLVLWMSDRYATAVTKPDAERVVCRLIRER